MISIYQRSWGLDSKVYTKTNDVRASSYAAQLGFAGVTSDMAEWSHAYNDVQVPYTIKNGFSIRAHKKDQKYLDENVSALIPANLTLIMRNCCMTSTVLLRLQLGR